MLHSAIFLGGGRGGEAEGRTWPNIDPFLLLKFYVQDLQKGWERKLTSVSIS